MRFLSDNSTDLVRHSVNSNDPIAVLPVNVIYRYRLLSFRMCIVLASLKSRTSIDY